MPIDVNTQGLEHIAQAYSSGMYQKPAHVEVLNQKQMQERSLTELLKQKGLELVNGVMSFGVGEAYAGERISVEDYYERATPADEIMPGAKIGGYKDPLIQGIGLLFTPSEWLNYYNNKNEEGIMFREILSQDKSAETFAKYISQHESEIRTFMFRISNDDKGYVVIAPKSREYKIIVPIDANIIRAIKEF